MVLKNKQRLATYQTAGHARISSDASTQQEDIYRIIDGQNAFTHSKTDPPPSIGSKIDIISQETDLDTP